MKKRIKIKISGFAPYHDPREHRYFKFLQERYDVVECEDPDYLLDGGQNFGHVKYNCVKILLSSENCTPDFDSYDYVVGCCEMSFGDRYVRIPWFNFYQYFFDIENRITRSDEELLDRKFCSFVVSNAEFGDPMRKLFFEELSKYKKVDSGGRYKNNVGRQVKDKLAFCSGYKFNIAFENSSFPGYTTEKIMEAYMAQSVPVYYGNPHVATDFLPSSMVVVRDRADVKRAVEAVVRLDQDDEAYLKVVKAPCLTELSPMVYENRLENFLANVFDQPFGEARRLCPYGQQAVMRRHMNYVKSIDQKVRNSWLFRMAASVRSRFNSM